MNNFATFKDIHDFCDADSTDKNNKPELTDIALNNLNRQANKLKFAICENLNNLETEWRELEQHSNISIYQRYDWIDACLRTLEANLNTKPQIITGRLDGKLVFVLPLVLQRGFARNYRWIGGNHSNYNLALIDKTFLGAMDEEGVSAIIKDACKTLPNTGYLKLCCQPYTWNDQPNPLQLLKHQRATNVALGMDLSGGFDDVLALVNGKRKRKKFRSQTRFVEELGGAKLIEATSKKQVQAILDCFYRQKSERFKDQGLKDVFGGPDTQHFLQQMAIDSLGSSQPLLKLYALEVDGKYRAICGGGVIDRHFSAYFTSFANDDLAHISPGEMLLYMLVEELCDAGFQSLDLGCGEERYKRSWCTKTFEMFDTVLTISPVSFGSVLVNRAFLGAKRNVRGNQRLWKYFKTSRLLITRLSDKITGK